MNPILAVLAVIAIVLSLSGGFCVLVALGALADRNESEKRRKS